jgi:hypothetical protein
MTFDETNKAPKFFGLVKKMIHAEPISIMMRGGLTTLSGILNYSSSTTALHEACKHDDLLSIVDMILSIDPQSIYELNSGGELPLHIACSYQQLNITKRLIGVYDAKGVPISFTMTLNGISPLHSALWNDDVDPELVRLLVKKYPLFVATKNEHHETPLHYACYRNAPIHVMEMLVRADRNVLGIEDKFGNIPFHTIFALYALDDLMPILRHLTPLLPELIKTRDKHGNLPGHEKVLEKFLADVTPLLETEYSLHEYLEWINETSWALCLCKGDRTVAIVLNWTTNRKDDCLKQLSSVASKLHDLIATHAECRRPVYSHRPLIRLKRTMNS